MPDMGIRERCHINTNHEADTFVGILCENGEYRVNFPLGFHLSEDDKNLRKDILLLINTIAATTAKKESTVIKENAFEFVEGFPIQSYIYLIYDYFSRGIYREQETQYSIKKRGKISWTRTIKTQKPYIQDDVAYYLQYVTKKNTINDNEIISKIHEYCVYDSFEKMGWLFTSAMIKKPNIKYNKRMFISIIRDKYKNTYNDKNKRLFRHMLAIVQWENDPDSQMNYKYGTNRFEYVWEAMIDKAFGIKDKDRFFPNTSWIVEDKLYNNRCLEPDSIMLWKDKVYVLDAKYYKYGATKRVSDLPESSSITKQITYGEYISKMMIDTEVYNAFLMPFDSNDPMWAGSDVIKTMGTAVSSWKNNEDNSYEKIQGILIDMKGLMGMMVTRTDYDLDMLADCIENQHKI